MSNKQKHTLRLGNPDYAKKRADRQRQREERKEAFVLILHPSLWKSDYEVAA